MDSDDCPENLIIAKQNLAVRNEEIKELAAKIDMADTELIIQHVENEKLVAGLAIADHELHLQQQQIVQAEQQIEFERHNIEALINNTDDLMWSVDTNFNLITSNKPFDDLVVLMGGMLLTKGNSILTAGFPQEQVARYKSSYERAFAGEIFTEVEHHLSPIEIWSEISYHPIKNGEKIEGASCHSRNITAGKNTEFERNDIAKDLIQRNKDLEEFAHMVSHNLRGPIACILGATMVFNEMKLSDEEKAFLATGIHESAAELDKVFTHLNQLIQPKHV